MDASSAVGFELLLLAVLLALSAFFSSAETSLFSLTSGQLAELRRRGHKQIARIEHLLESPRRLIVTILIGNELVNVSASAISAALVIQFLGPERAWVNLVVMVPLLLLFGEITPKTLAMRHNVAFAAVQSRPLELFAVAVSPLRLVVRRVADWSITFLVGRERSRGNLLTEDMVRTLAREAVGEGALDQTEASYIAKIFDFGDTTVADVATPRAGIFFLPADLGVDEVIAELRRSGHSRAPVYSGTRDDVIGILYARDLLGQDLERLRRRPAELRRLLRRPLFVPDTKPVSALLHDFRERRRSLALTVDEYGGVTGLVTVDDLLDRIFGERTSSRGPEETDLAAVGVGRWRLAGSTRVREVAERFAVPLDTEIADTLGGLLLHTHGELPAPGSLVDLPGLECRVLAVERNRVIDVEIRRTDTGAPTEEPS